MSDSEFFTIEGTGYGTAVAEYPNYEEALTDARGLAPDHVGALVIVRWTRTEVTKVQREINVKSEDMMATKADATSASKMP